MKPRHKFAFLCLFAALAITSYGNADESEPSVAPSDTSSDSDSDSIRVATFAGGCFWCMEPPFDEMQGVLSTTSGYTGGRIDDPTYDQVKTGRTGHIESMQVKFDSSVVTYQKLLWLFWHNVDPTQAGGQFCDRGNQYRTAIFYHDEKQKELAQETKAEVRGQLGKRVHTEIIAATEFYPAEDYHQDYYRKNPKKYKFYRFTCGRDRQLDAVWGDKARKP